MANQEIEKAKELFGTVLEQQVARVEKMKTSEEPTDYTKLDKIIVGIIPGDGIGDFIAKESKDVLAHILKDDLDSGKIEFRDISMTIEERAKVGKPIPDDTLEAIKQCHVTLKGPTTTPRKGDPWPNIESANVAMRKELDLYCNFRPVKVPQEGIDWAFFRENTEGAYALGSQGINVNDDIAIDFAVTTTRGSERLIKMAFEYAKKNNRDKLTIVTKANVVKTTDGKFLAIAQEIAKGYPDVEMDDWYIDIMTAKLVDTKRRSSFQVMALPNLYGDILTDEAAEFQGGVGTAGSANLGDKYSMFEAIHGSAPRMVDEGRAQYADPCSMVRAGALLLNHIGYQDQGKKLEMALDICGQFEQKMKMTGRDTGVTGSEYTKYVLETMADEKLQERWDGYQKEAVASAK